MISIVVPSYNEEKHIVETLEALLDLGDVEIIIAEDGSTDATVDIINGYSKKYENIIVTSEPVRSGKGAAIKRGLNFAKGDLLGFIDADMATHPQELLKLKDEIYSGADIAIGSRNLQESDIKIRQPPHRIFLGWVYRGLVRSLLNVDVRDFQCGCKLFKREVWETVDVLSDDFAFDTELLAKASARSYTISEVPITWKNSEGSKVSPVTDTLKMFRTVLKVRSEINADK